MLYKFIFGLKRKTVGFLIPLVSDHDNEHETIKTKNGTGLKKFKPEHKHVSTCICRYIASFAFSSVYLATLPIKYSHF